MMGYYEDRISQIREEAVQVRLHLIGDMGRGIGQPLARLYEELSDADMALKVAGRSAKVFDEMLATKGGN